MPLSVQSSLSRTRHRIFYSLVPRRLSQTLKSNLGYSSSITRVCAFKKPKISSSQSSRTPILPPLISLSLEGSFMKLEVKSG
ncbi:hypothetical protein N7501_001589 [Penicillium viridicatum]|nr:hypothetical protein N7501_001589 [Penicillium viridicatum]